MTAIDRPTTARVPDTAVARALAWLQVMFWGAYLLVLVKLLVAGIKYGGFGFQPFGTDPTLYDPKELFGWGVPEYILQAPLDIVVIFGTVPAALILLASLPVAGMLWRARAPHRWVLTVSTMLNLAFLAVQFTPFHTLIVEWMLD